MECDEIAEETKPSMIPIAGRAVFSRLPLWVVFLCIAAVISACATESSSPAGQNLEVVAQGIDQNLMCPICPSETIDQSQTEIAEQMRRTVRERLEQGESRDEVLQVLRRQVRRVDPGGSTQVRVQPPGVAHSPARAGRRRRRACARAEIHAPGASQKRGGAGGGGRRAGDLPDRS